MSLSKKARRGLEVVGEMHGAEAAAQLEKLATRDAYGAEITRLALEFAFADAWGRPGLSRREKSIAIVSVLVALKFEHELKNHVKLGVLNGLSAADFESLGVQLVPYVGFPCVAAAQAHIKEALSDAGVDVSRSGTKVSGD